MNIAKISCKKTWKKNSIHELLIEKYKLPLTRVWQHLQAVALTEEEALRLDCPMGTAAFLLERLSYTFEHPISWVKYLMRGDKYSFENAFSPHIPTLAAASISGGRA